ncbi:PspA/IM30 family protein [Hartmannibacter diazotrophicus]|nr:PspA/IM30 family protein [Hartmannibacter diazotrophicus]
MFKQLFALVRGEAFEAAERTVDRHALPILRQQIRDCAAAIEAARKAVAVAIAQNDQEIRQHNRIVERIADLEQRTLAALEQGRDDLAREAAETIACLEAERDASAEAQAQFAGEIDRLKRIVRLSRARLADLERGQRIAAATDRTQRLRETGHGHSLSTLKDAEETLGRLRLRQRQIDVAAEAMAEMEACGDPAAMSEKLAKAGCGAPLKASADDVLSRLKARMARADAPAG